MPDFSKYIKPALAGLTVGAGYGDPANAGQLATAWLQSKQTQNQMDQYAQGLKLQKQEMDLKSRYYDMMERQAAGPKQWEEENRLRRNIADYIVVNSPELVSMAPSQRMTTILSGVKDSTPSMVKDEIESIYPVKDNIYLRVNEMAGQPGQTVFDFIDSSKGQVADSLTLPIPFKDLDLDNPVHKVAFMDFLDVQLQGAKSRDDKQMGARLAGLKVAFQSEGPDAEKSKEKWMKEYARLGPEGMSKKYGLAWPGMEQALSMKVKPEMSTNDILRRISDIEKTKAQLKATGGVSQYTLMNFPKVAEFIQGGDIEGAIGALDTEKLNLMQQLPPDIRSFYADPLGML